MGKNVKHIQVGDRVGVGAQARSCGEEDCSDCSAGRENYCARENISTYNSKYPGDEGKSYGGYADYNRTNARFVVKIPDGLPSEDAAPMLCGGVTVYSPLRKNGCGPGKRVGVVGVGGLGHFAVLFAKVLGADKVVGVSRKASKKDEVLKLGADDYIATDDDSDWVAKNARSLDLIISTVSSEKMPLEGYLKLLDTHGTFIQVGYVRNSWTIISPSRLKLMLTLQTALRTVAAFPRSTPSRFSAAASRWAVAASDLPVKSARCCSWPPIRM